MNKNKKDLFLKAYANDLEQKLIEKEKIRKMI